MANVYKALYDINCNGNLSLMDVSVELAQVGPTPTSIYDLNGEGHCTLTDVNIQLAAINAASSGPDKVQLTRDKYLWPFASTSIWNQPLARGNEAHFVAAGLTPGSGFKFGADENIIVNSPASTPIDVWNNDVDWDAPKYGQGNLWQYRLRTDAGVSASSTGTSVPWPAGYVLPGGDFQNDSPNFATAIVNADGLGITQLQPATMGTSNVNATAPQPWNGNSVSPAHVITEFDLKADTVDLKADDIVSTVKASYGSQGGSGMSGLGGCIRLGELTPVNRFGFIRHALKIEAQGEVWYSDHDYTSSGGGVGFRWPATSKDANVTQSGAVAAMTYGSLLALKTSFNVHGLTTEPARIIARTLMRYGAYVVDSSSQDDVWLFCTERGPAGRVVGPPDPGAMGPEEFAPVWASAGATIAGPSTGGHGFGAGDQPVNSRWPEFQADMKTVITNLWVVDNNAQTAIGGPTIAGTSPALRLAPPAPAFSN